jgi:hypothetical protein
MIYEKVSTFQVEPEGEGLEEVEQVEAVEASKRWEGVGLAAYHHLEPPEEEDEV